MNDVAQRGDSYSGGCTHTHTHTHTQKEKKKEEDVNLGVAGSDFPDNSYCAVAAVGEKLDMNVSVTATVQWRLGEKLDMNGSVTASVYTERQDTRGSAPAVMSCSSCLLYPHVPTQCSSCHV